MVENDQGISEQQHGTGKPGIRRRIAPRLTIGVKFVSFVVLVALLAGGVAGLVTIKTSRDTMRKEVLQNNLTQADLAAAFASNYLKVVQAHIKVFAERPDIRQPVLNNQSEQIQTTLTQFVQIQTALASAAFTDENGIQRVFSQTGVTTVGQSFTDRDYFQQSAITLQPYQGQAVKSRATGQLVAPYGVPILDDQGKFRGVLSGGISLAALSDAIVAVNYGSNTSATMIDIPHSLIIAHSDPQLLLTPVSKDNEAVRHLAAGERGAIETTDISMELDLIGFAAVPDLPWGVMVITPSKSAFATVNSLTRNASLFTGLIIILAAVVGVFLILSIVRPVRRLVEGTKEIGRGNLDYQVDTKARDEIGDLSRAFGQMAQELKQTLVSRDELVKEVAERKKAEDALRQSEGKYRNLFQNAEVGMYRSKLDGSAILAINHKLCEIFGYSEEEMLRNPATIRWANIEARNRMVSELRKSGGLSNYEMDIVTKSGQIRTCSVSVILFPEQGYLEGSAIDVTERRRLEQEREKFDQELKEKNTELERFLYTVSHDLKSPLVTVKTFLGYLKQDIAGSDAGRIVQDMQYMNGAADKMGKLLEELLEMSRIGRIVNPVVTVTFQELVQETLSLLAGHIEERRVKVQVSDEPITLYGDRPRLVEIWQNLVENAIKFMGDQPSPRVDIGVEHRTHETVFFVRDNGIGINPKYQPKLFNLFEKINPKSEGTGMGLAIAKRIVELYQGKIWVESQGLGQGTCFRFTLPGALKDKSEGG